jgi:hypothetical protein
MFTLVFRYFDFSLYFVAVFAKVVAVVVAVFWGSVFYV